MVLTVSLLKAYVLEYIGHFHIFFFSNIQKCLESVRFYHLTVAFHYFMAMIRFEIDHVELLRR